MQVVRCRVICRFLQAIVAVFSPGDEGWKHGIQGFKTRLVSSKRRFVLHYTSSSEFSDMDGDV